MVASDSHIGFKIFEKLGIQIKGQNIYEAILHVKCNDAVRVIIKRFVDAGDIEGLKDITENYELVKKED